LTFDDGPTPGITDKVLDLLQQYKAEATFFVCGKHVKLHPDLYRKIKDSGHSVGNHTYQHISGWKTSTGKYLSDVEKTGEYVRSKLFRPPYGKLKFRQYLYLRKKFRIIIWDVMCMDFDRNTDPQTCFGHISNHAGKGSIIVFHDSAKAAANMLYALEQTLMVFSGKGYRFEKLQ
ncbi:MAG: polysaccharide deacetylase family protein, partial [Bacteroidales bacterium]|nr:polysaccharide deacetylase family protein [Bacteroidales bacterium]